MAEMEIEPELLQLDPAQSRIEDLNFSVVHLGAPSWYINPSFVTLFKERSTYDSIAACSPLSLPPMLAGVLSSGDPPSLDFFKSLPPPPSTPSWGIYALLLEKDGCKPLLYIGSGTGADQGVSKRVNYYKPGASQLPRFVNKAFNDGYHISHRGLLCWTSLPRASLVPRVRARFLVLEATFTMMFHASIPAITDMYYKHLVLWPRDTVEWGPLCSHLSLKEKIQGDLSLSSEELESVAAIRKARAHEVAIAGSQRHRAAKRAADPDAYKLKVRSDKQAWSEKNRDRVSKTSRKSQTKAREEKRFYCDVCELALQSNSALQKHLLTPTHKDRVAGVEKTAPAKSSMSNQVQRGILKANKTHYCSTCEKAFDSDFSLVRHKATKKHTKTLEKLQSSQ